MASLALPTGPRPGPAAAIGATPERIGLGFDLARDPEAFDRYRSFYALGADVAPLGRDFRGELSCLRLDRMMIHRRRLRSVAHWRTPERVRRDDLGHYTVTLCLGGTMYGEDGDGYRRVRPGELWLSDMARPVRTRLVDARLLTLAVGRELVEASGMRDPHASVLPAARAAPLARVLAMLAHRPEPLGVDEAVDASRSLVRLIGDTLGPPAPADAAWLDRLARARRLIEMHLDAPDLDAAFIAAELHVSRSTVYRLFDRAGGVARFIQARRVDRLRRLLAERTVGTSLAELAEVVGLASESHASRLFLERYGVRPGAFRTDARRLSDFGVGRLRMGDWLRALQ